MKIYITAHILTGSLGDGWINNDETANALAAYTYKRWMMDLEDIIEEEHEVEIEIKTQRDASGWCRDLDVWVESSACGFDGVALDQRVENALTAECDIWVAFCESEEAANLMS